MKEYKILNTNKMDEERITFIQVCKNVYQIPHKAGIIYLQNLKNAFREVYLTLNSQRMFSITEDEWDDLSILVQNSINKWNMVEFTQLGKIKWSLRACSVKIERSGDDVYIVLEKKGNPFRNKLWLKMGDINQFLEFINNFFDEAAV